MNANQKIKAEQRPILEKYAKLAKKLGTLPNSSQTRIYVASRDLLVRLFGKEKLIKVEAIKEFPWLEDLCVAAEIDNSDVLNQELKNISTHNKKMTKEMVKGATFLEYMCDVASQVFDGQIKPVKVCKGSKKTERVINVILSDLHIGADVLAEETGILNYGKIEESRRLAAIVKQIINYKPQYRKETKLILVMNGDNLHGEIHDPRTGANMAEQFCRGVHLLGQAVSVLAAEFKEVEVQCTTGNHTRHVSRHPKRAVNQKWDSYETMMHYALKAYLNKQTNVTFFMPKTPYGVYQVFGQKILYTHGDNFFSSGKPNESINIKAIETKLNKINSSLHDNKEYKAVLLGHLHIASQTYLPNGAVVITNGATIPPEDFCTSIGITEAQTGQILFESVPGHVVGDLRFLKVTSEHDKDSSLDKIIKPFVGLNE